MGNNNGTCQKYIINHLIILTSNLPKSLDGDEIDDELYIKKYNIPMSNPEVEQKDLAKCKYVLIRHALSKMNYLLNSRVLGSPSFVNKAFGDEYRDATLHRIGIQQCRNNQKNVNSINWKIVYTSPFRRNIQTTMYLFENHPNKANIKFIVLPIVREYIVCMDDVNEDIYQTIHTYSQEGKKCGVNFDFSHILDMASPQLWAIETMGITKRKEEIMKEILPQP